MTAPLPSRFEVQSSAEFFELCRRAEAGEFRISMLERSKKGNAVWIVSVIYGPTLKSLKQENLL